MTQCVICGANLGESTWLEQLHAELKGKRSDDNDLIREAWCRLVSECDATFDLLRPHMTKRNRNVWFNKIVCDRLRIHRQPGKWGLDAMINEARALVTIAYTMAGLRGPIGKPVPIEPEPSALAASIERVMNDESEDATSKLHAIKALALGSTGQATMAQLPVVAPRPHHL